MNGLLNWYTRYYAEITWFIIGWLAMCTLVDFGKGDMLSVIFDLALIALNYFLYRR